MLRKIADDLRQCLPCLFEIRIGFRGMDLPEPIVGISCVLTIRKPVNLRFKLSNCHLILPVANQYLGGLVQVFFAEVFIDNCDC